MIVEVTSHRPAARIASAVMFLAFGLFGWMGYRRGTTSVPLFIKVAIPLIWLFVGWHLWRRRRNNKILVWNDGIQVIRKGKPSPVYSWVDIDSFRKSNVDGCAIVRLRDGDAVRLFGEDFFGSHMKTAQFVDRLERCQDEFLRICAR